VGSVPLFVICLSLSLRATIAHNGFGLCSMGGLKARLPSASTKIIETTASWRYPSAADAASPC